uniref:Alkaline phosphatase n=1 Tax=Cyanothece sp. (strain PCC 7425 / ATCC 29141) TaxID=395961 RepID=B8HNM8_CYAP4
MIPSNLDRLLGLKLQRRSLLLGTGFLAALACSEVLSHASTATIAQPKFAAYPFSLGVASGDPLPESVVLWTRLAPDPLKGMSLPPVNIPVEWLVAKDEKLTQVVAKGTTLAQPELAHSVHVVVEGLEPGRWYWYQFKAGNEVSPIGRTRTAPALGAPLDRLAIAFASCQNYEQGYYTAYQHMAREDLDLVFHLGDYIYEGTAQPGHPRQHLGPNPVDLETYRLRYALYKTDPDLQAAHAAFPFICTWDDHEVENDYAGDQSQTFADPAQFRQQRLAAYQAYYEHLPLRPTAMLQGTSMQLYRQFNFGNLAQFHVLDSRQYRDDQPCANGKGGGQLVSNCQSRLASDRTLLGQQQERWLLDGLGRSQSRWNVIAQQYLMAELDQLPGAGEVYWSDNWDGYAASRKRILEFIDQRQIANAVVLGGDIHSFWVTDLKPDFRDEQSPVVATEFVGTSISSKGIPYDFFAGLLTNNPQIKFFESRFRGYVQCTLTPDRWTTHLRVVDSVAQPGAPLRTLATFVVENGRPGAVRA